MSTQEREAMERLVPEEYIHAPSGMGPLAYQWEDKPHRLVYELANEVQKLYAKEDARHARSRQPITVEGLVACDMDRWMEGGIVCFEKGPVRVLWGLLPHVFLRGEMCHPQPTNMAQIDDLLSR